MLPLATGVLIALMGHQRGINHLYKLKIGYLSASFPADFLEIVALEFPSPHLLGHLGYQNNA